MQDEYVPINNNNISSSSSQKSGIAVNALTLLIAVATLVVAILAVRWIHEIKAEVVQCIYGNRYIIFSHGNSSVFQPIQAASSFGALRVVHGIPHQIYYVREFALEVW